MHRAKHFLLPPPQFENKFKNKIIRKARRIEQKKRKKSFCWNVSRMSTSKWQKLSPATNRVNRQKVNRVWKNFNAELNKNGREKNENQVVEGETEERKGREKNEKQKKKMKVISQS